MLPEQQQRILGYFIEEARDHLNTIEQGLLNLQSTLNDPELINEVFRAAHSIKGGAAMLGLTSIQHTAHRLEDCFKVLKETPIQVDQKLESLFLGVSDTLKALLEQLSGPFGLSEETANTLMSETEPVFQWLNQHLELLVQQGGASVDTSDVNHPSAADSVGTLTEIFFRQDVPTPSINTPAPEPVTATASDDWGEFQTQVLQILREMLQLFKQAATPESRQNLQQCCNQLVKLGQTWNLPNWCNLCKAAATAIGNPENSYLTLAKIVITEIKQAQELVLHGRETEITISQQLEALWDFPETALMEVAQELLGDVPSTVAQSLITPAKSESTPIITEVSSATDEESIINNIVELPTDRVTSLTEVSEQLDIQTDAQVTLENTVPEHDAGANLFWDSETTPFVNAAKIETNGPEVGLAELNTLADLFEGETPELDENWQQEEVIEIADSSELGVDVSETIIQEFDSDLADFLSLDRNDHESQSSTNKTEDFGLLFGEHLPEPEKLTNNIHNETQVLITEFQDNQEQFDADTIADFLNITNISDINTQDNQSLASFVEEEKSVGGLDDLFIEQELNTNTFEEIKLDNYLDEQIENTSLDNLFTGLDSSPQIFAEESVIIDNLFDEQPITILEFTAPTADDLYQQETSEKAEQLLSSLVENEIAKELEESLFAAAGEIFPDIADTTNSALESFEEDDLNTTFFQLEEDLDFIITPENDNLLAEVTSTDSIVNASTSCEISVTETQGFSQAPEVLDFIPEFTNQLQETSSLETEISFGELENNVLIGNNNDTAPVLEDKLFSITNDLSLQNEQDLQSITNSIELADLEEDSELELADNALAITNELPTNNLEEWAIPISELTDIVIDDITEDESRTISDISADEVDEATSDLDFGEFVIPTSELTETTIQDFTEHLSLETSEDLLTTLDEATSDLDFGEFVTTASELTETTIQDFTENLSLETSEDLLTTLDEATSDLDFGEFVTTASELTETTIQDFTENLSLETSEDSLTTVDEATSDLDFGEFVTPTSELTETTIQDFTENLSLETSEDSLTTVDEAISDLDFGEFVTPTSELIAENFTENLSLATGDELLTTASGETHDLDFGEFVTTASELTETTIQDFTEHLSLETSEDSLTTVDEAISDLDFGEFVTTASELRETTIQDFTENLSLETSEDSLTTVDEATSDLDFGEFVTPNSKLITENFTENLSIETSKDLLTTVDEATSDLDFGEFVTPTDELRETTIPEIPESSSVEILETTELIQNEIADIDSNNTTELQKQTEINIEDEFADLEALLETSPSNDISSIQEDDFAALEALLGEDDSQTMPDELQPPAIANAAPKFSPVTTSNPIASPVVKDEFGDLEKLLAEADQTISQSTPVKQNAAKLQRSSNRRQAKFEETMKVPVKQLDDMSNLVGELVVNRNTLEQDHERLRQSLDNLLVQVQQLSDVGARMQELYERSLLEASLLASRKTRETPFHSDDSHSDRGFSELEMDRFTPFHTLSQEMIELIVRVRESASDIDFVTEETERVARQFRQVTSQLQEGLTRARMVPFSQTIDRLRRGVRDNAIKCGKQVELMIEGGETLIDKMILDHLTDPLTHMLNNAIAHGIETPDVRQAAGKPPVGIITIRAFHQGNQTVISVGDDGAGIDTEKIKTLAVNRSIITPAQAKTISRLEIYDLLFQSGFSTKDEADEISGRGVGMDVVRSEISEIRGTVNTDSTLGKGTTFTIRLPLTLSICKALCCVSDKARVAFPMDGVEDTLDMPIKNIQKNTEGQSFISWRDTILPFRPLKELLTFNRQLSRGNVYGGNRDDDMVSVVVVRSGNTLLALQIDQVLSEQEIVIKQFEGPAPKPIGVAGATVLGDGRIMPIADVLELIDIFQGRMSKHSGGTPWQPASTPTQPEILSEKIDPTVLIVDDSITVRELLSLTFNKAGYRVEQARDGQEAWDKLRSGLPCDIVFCDIEMPRCDGLELLSRIQKDFNLNHLPIAMLTSRGADKHRQMAIQLGASGYFTKPYLEEALLEAAVRMLKGEKLVNSSGNS